MLFGTFCNFFPQIHLIHVWLTLWMQNLLLWWFFLFWSSPDHMLLSMSLSLSPLNFHIVAKRNLIFRSLGLFNSGVYNPWATDEVPVRGLLGTGLQSRKWAAGEQVKLYLYLQPLPITHISAWALPPVRSGAALDSRRIMNPSVNCTCKEPRLRALYETPLELRRWC